MIARVKVYAPDGVTARTADVGYGAGILPTIGLTFSVEVGGAGGCTFTALADDLDDLSARDSVIHVELETSPGIWTAVAAYTLRPPFRRTRVGYQQVECIGVALLEQWASETVILPEYSDGGIPPGAGEERGLGWMGTAFSEGGLGGRPYGTSRTAMPVDWPSGTGAKWISIAGATAESERKLFRSAPVGATTGAVRIYFASDETATVYFGGEPVMHYSATESSGSDPVVETVTIKVSSGNYAVAVDTASVWTSGGDGVDPILLALCSLDVDGNPDEWLLVSDENAWYATRRDLEPPGNDPPGPAPGDLIMQLVDEAKARGATGWANVTYGFDGAADSYGNGWVHEVVERLVRYGMDDYWAVFQMLGESDEATVWLSPTLVLHAASSQGQASAVVLDTTDVVTMSDQTSAVEGTWAMGLARDGWVTGEQGTPRREYGLEVGTALTGAVASRVVTAALAENGRWDGSCRLAPGAPTPLVDFFVGDTIGLSYADAPASVQVLSVSAEAGEGGLLWDLELAELPS